MDFGLGSQKKILVAERRDDNLATYSFGAGLFGYKIKNGSVKNLKEKKHEGKKKN